MKDLPKIFANPIDKNISNNRNFSYGKLDDEKKERNEVQVLEKIEKFFGSEIVNASRNFLIKFEKKEDVYTIIGRTSNNLVTKAEKLIPIRDIYDISEI